MQTEDQQYSVWLHAPTINLQQSQVVNDNHTLKHNTSSGPPRPPRLMPMHTIATTTTVANPITPITHTTPI